MKFNHRKNLREGLTPHAGPGYALDVRLFLSLFLCVGASHAADAPTDPLAILLEHELGAKTQLAARIGSCPPGSVAANAYGQQLDAVPGEHAALDSIKEMEKYTACDRQEAEAEMDCGEKDTTCRGDRLLALGYDFKYCPNRVHMPSSGSKSGQAAVPRGMRPFQYVRCVPKSSLPEYDKAIRMEGAQRPTT